MRIKRSFAVVAVSALAGAAVWAQGRNVGPEWQAASADAQRTSWQRSDPNITVENLSKPGFELQWKATLGRGSLQMSEAVGVNGVGLFWPAALIAGSTNSLSLVDNDTGNVQWTRAFGSTRGTPTAGCSGPVAAAARPIALVPPEPQPARAGGGGGRGGGYRGAVGAPGEGVPVELSQRGGGGRNAAPPGAPGAPVGAPPAGAAPPPATAPQAAPRAGGVPAVAPPGAEAGRGVVPGPPRGGGGGGLGRLPGPAYAIADDGSLHTMGWLSGKDVQKPAPFLPSNARSSDPVLVDNMLYTTTSGGCGGAPNAVWMIDVSNEATKPAVSWRTNGGSPIGAVALGTTGNVIASIGPGQAAAGGYANAVVALDPKTLQIKDWFTAPGTEIASAPVVFRHNDKDVVAVVAKDGRVLLLDGGSLGGASHSTPQYASPSLASPPSAFTPQAVATWQEASGTRWVLVPSTSTIVAFKVVNVGSMPSLERVWESANFGTTVTPIIVNNVVFAAATGRPNGKAVLHALDGTTGKAVWNSGATMTTAMSGRALWSSNSQVYVGTADGTVYAFGFVLERK